MASCVEEKRNGKESAMTDPALSSDLSGVVTGLFRGRDGAECAYQAAAELGYQASDINLVMSDEARRQFFSSEPRVNTELSDKVAETTTGSTKLAEELGGPAGGAIGTLAPVLA